MSPCTLHFSVGIAFREDYKKGERNLKVVDGKKIEAEAVGVSPIALGGGYIPLLNNVFMLIV